MKQLTWAFFLVLAAYSAMLMVIEAQTSQAFVRHYFSDIEGTRPFFAVNTTLSCFFLAGGAMLFLFTAFSGRRDLSPTARKFLLSQAGMLLFLAFDDRFQLHEALAYRIGVADHFIMAGWALLELVLIFTLARLADITLRSALLVAAGGMFFAVMMLFDAVVPHQMILRLSIEDLAKSWAAALFFAAAWCLSRFHLKLDEDALTLDRWLAAIGKRAINEDLRAGD